MTDKPYFRVIVWKKKHDAAVREAYRQVFGRPLAQKTPRQSRLCGSYMIGTHGFTPDKEAVMKSLLKRKARLLVRTPRIWWDL